MPAIRQSNFMRLGTGHLPLVFASKRPSADIRGPGLAAPKRPLEFVRRPEGGPATARARLQAPDGAPRHYVRVVRSRWPICFGISGLGHGFSASGRTSKSKRRGASACRKLAAVESAVSVVLTHRVAATERRLI